MALPPWQEPGANQSGQQPQQPSYGNPYGGPSRPQGPYDFSPNNPNNPNSFGQPAKPSGNGWMWVAVGVGCGTLLLLGTCTAGMAYWLYQKQEREHTAQRDRDDLRSPSRSPSNQSPSNQSPSNQPSNQAASLPPDASLAVEARVTAAEGSSLRVGSTCNFNVQRIPRSDGTFWCNAQVVCGGVQVYGGTGSGFFPCTWYEAPNAGVVGSDDDMSGSDRDGAFDINTVSHTLSIRDDAAGTLGAFSLTAEITSVQEVR